MTLHQLRRKNLKTKLNGAIGRILIMIIQMDEGWAGKPHLNFLFTEVKVTKGKTANVPDGEGS